MIVDLFCGARGWTVGLRSLGIDDIGVEIWQPAVDTSMAAGMATIQADASELDPITCDGLDRPATTVCADSRIAPPGHRDRAGGERQFAAGTVRLTIKQALILQGFPADYPVQGNKTDAFTQVGNAVPPPLAAAIVGALA